jgi:branched-chain amino acid transport system substrate-binding protein
MLSFLGGTALTGRASRWLVAALVITGVAGIGAAESAPAAASGDSAPFIIGGDGAVAVAPGTAQGFEAGIYRFNKAGGLDGRKIKFIGFLDDGLSTATDLANAQKLVNEDHVFAVAPVNSQFAGPATGSFLAKSHTPFIGWATSAAYASDAGGKWALPIDGYQVNPSVQGVTEMLQVIAAQGDKSQPSKVKMALIANDVPGAVAVNESYAAAAKSVGIDVVYVKAPIAPEGTTTYAPEAQALESSGANTVYEVVGNTDAVGLAAALKAVNYKGMVVNGVTYFPGQLASQPSEKAALQGVYVATEFPTQNNDTAAVKQAEKDLVATGQSPQLTAGISQGYWTAIVLEQMLRATLARVGSASKVTSAALEQTVSAGKGWSYKDPIAGGIGTETFPAAYTYPTSCNTLVKTVGNGYTQVEPYQCTYDVNVSTNEKIDPQTGKASK